MRQGKQSAAPTLVVYVVWLPQPDVKSVLYQCQDAVRGRDLARDEPEGPHGVIKFCRVLPCRFDRLEGVEVDDDLAAYRVLEPCIGFSL